MIYSPFNQNNFHSYETYNSQVVLAASINTQYNESQGRSSNRFISKSLAAICDERKEPQIKEDFYYARQSNILMGIPITGAIDSPIYTPKYNSQNDPSIYIAVGDVSDNVISQHSIYNYIPPSNSKVSRRSIYENNKEVENYLNINPYKDTLQDPYKRNAKKTRKDILELHEAYAEFKEFEKQKVKCVKCANDVSKNKSFIYSGNFVCSTCATNIQSNYLQDWIPRETRLFTGPTRKCDNCKRRRPTSQFVYKTFTGDLDYNTLCRFCLLKKATCSHQAGFRKRYHNLYKYKKDNYYDNSIHAIIENDDDDKDDDNEEDEEYEVESDKFGIDRSNLLSKSPKPLSPQMIQFRPPQEEKIVMPKKRGRKRKNIEILMQQSKEIEELSKKLYGSKSTEVSGSTNKSGGNTSINSNSNSNSNFGINSSRPITPINNILNINSRNINISSSYRNNNGNININVYNNDNNNNNNNNNYRFANRTSSSFFNTFISADIRIPKPSRSQTPTPTPSTPPPNTNTNTINHTEHPAPHIVKLTHADLKEKLQKLIDSKKYHNNPQIVKFDDEERIVVSNIGSIPLNIGTAFSLYKLNLSMLVRCSVCNKNITKDRCIVNIKKCYVCNLCMKSHEEKSDWSLLENNRSVNDILCISCKMRKAVDQFLRMDEDGVLCIANVCRHCYLTKKKGLNYIR